MLDRRRLLTLGLTAGASLALPSAAGAQALPNAEPQLVAALLDMELLSVAALERVLASAHLRRRALQLARRVLLAERAHATALGRALVGLGRPAPPAPPPPLTVSAIDRGLSARHVSRAIGELHNEHDCLDLLLDLESMAEGLYYAAVPLLKDTALQRLAAGLLASEAEHEALLGLVRNPHDFDRAAPYAFVEGIKP